jgi:serine/threonine protein phosphatase 1
MRTLVIADIHGCCNAFRTLLDAVQPAADDHLITLGDYIDRGPDSSGVVRTLLDVRTRTRLFPLMGNHEELLLNARGNTAQYLDWLLAGGQATLRSYGGAGAAFSDILDEHWDFFGALLPYVETPTNLITHATPDPILPLALQPKHYLRWNRFDQAQPHASGKPIICGHTPQKNGWPRDLGFAINLDTHPFGADGWLTCLHVETGELIQANEKRQTRKTQRRELAGVGL